MPRRRMPATAVAAALLVPVSVLHGATITADGTTCTLANAILSAEADSDTGGCTGVDPYGADTIYLDYDVTLSAADTVNSTLRNSTYAGLPDVTSVLTIEGRDGRIVQRDPSFGCAPNDANQFRLFQIFGDASLLTLVDLELRNGCAAPASASLAAGGTIYMDNAHLVVTRGAIEGSRAVATGSSTAAWGGAIYLFGGKGITSDVAFTGCHLTDNGAIAAMLGAPSDARGGAVYVGGDSEISITDCELTGNVARGGDGGGGDATGGAIAFGSGSSDITSVTGSIFRGNRAIGGNGLDLLTLGGPGAALGGTSGGDANGGAIGYTGANGMIATLTRTIFEGNEALGGEALLDGGDAAGGAISCFGSCWAPDADDVLFVGNRAVGGDSVGTAAGGAAEGGAAQFSDTDGWAAITYDSNLARGGSGGTGGAARGGAATFESSPGIHANVTASGNRAVGGDATNTSAAGSARGGAFYDDIGITLRSASLADNRAEAGAGPGTPAVGSGGGLYVTTVDPRVEYLAAAGNVAVDGAGSETANDCHRETGLTSGGANVVAAPGNCTTDLVEGTDAPGTDPLLGALGDYGCTEPMPDGGCLPTMPLDLASPAIDLGDGIGLGGRDARGFQRGTNLGGAEIFDSGAYEQQNVLYVDASATGGANTGASWTDACVSLHDALDGSCSDVPPFSGSLLGGAPEWGDIWIAQGVYRPDEGSGAVADDPDESFPVFPGTSLFGGFAGGETSLDERDPVANLTILSGDIDGNDTVDGDGVTPDWSDIAGTNAYHLIRTPEVVSPLILDGLVLTGGAAFTGAGDLVGAAVWCEPETGLVLLRGVRVAGNAVDDRGVFFGCDLVASDSSFEGNGAQDVGAIQAEGPAIFVRSRFESNLASQQGSIAYVDDSPVTVRDSIVVGEQGNSVGALRSGGPIVLENVVFSGLSSGGAAVLQLVGPGEATLTNVTISGNIDYGSVGAIDQAGTGRLRIRNSVLWNNRLDTTTGSLGASITDDGAGGTIEIRHSILQGSGGSGAWTAPFIDGGGNLDVDPDFVTDVDPATAPTTDGDLRLRLASPAIDTGDDSVVTALTDIDGFDRIDGLAVDLGPWERTGEIFSDGFESGDVCAWSGSVGAALSLGC